MKTLPDFGLEKLEKLRLKEKWNYRLFFGIFVFLLSYQVTIAQNREIELANNGNFNSGTLYNGYNSDVSTNWSYGYHTLTQNPNSAQNWAPSFTDHTGNGGYMMFVDGPGNAGHRIWYNTYNVTAGSVLTMSVWVRDFWGGSTAGMLYWGINGNQVGSVVTAVAGSWTQVTTTYTVTSSGTITVAIHNQQNSNPSGNDFAIDDVSVKLSVPVTCSGNYYDTGGNGSNYSNNEDYTETFCADYGDNIRFSFNQFSVENGWDFLRIYDGTSTSAPSLGTYTGNNSPGTVTSTTGCLTFRFTADYIINRSGWRAAISCVPDPNCNDINQVLINDLGGGPDVDITGGATVYDGQLPTNWNIEGNSTGSVGSMQFEVTGDASQSNIENASPYRMPNDNTPLNWPAGTYNLKVTQYSGSSGSGNVCDVEDFTLIIDQCAISNFTVGSNNSGLCTGMDLNLTATGGGAGATYSWVGPNSFTANQQNPTLPSIGNAAAGVYFATVTNTGCSATASTNVTVSTSPNVSVTSQNASCGLNNGSITFTFPDQSGRTNIEFSTNGGSTYPTYVADNIGSTTVSNIGPGTYDLWTRWGDNFCPVNLPDVTIARASGTLTTSGNVTECAGENSNLSVSLQNGVGPINYAWSNGLGTGSSKTVNPNSTITYSITATDNQGCTGTGNITVNVNALPSVVVNSNSPVCAGGTINLTSGGGTSYTWTGPNGFTSSFQNPSIVNATSANGGSYSITVTDGNGCSASAQIGVLINSGLTIAASTPLSQLCVGQNLNLNATNGANSYSWQGPNGFSSNSQNPVISNAQTNRSGTYTVTGTLLSGCSASATTSVNVITNAPTASNDSPKCEGNPINITSSGGDGYSWSGPNGFTSNLQNPTLPNSNLAQEGIYTVTVTIGGVCPVTATTEINLYTLPNISVSNTGPVCLGGNISLQASGGTSYSWVGPNGFTSNNQNPSIFNVNNTKTGIYTVTVTNASLCTATATTEVSLSFPSLTVSADTALCEGGTISLSASGAVSYLWTGPNSFSSNLASVDIPTATTAMGGIYTVTISNALGCSATSGVNIKVLSTTAPITSNSGICTGDTLKMTLPDWDNYTWTGPGGFSASVEDPFIVNATTANSGVYNLTVNVPGCTVTATTSLVVRALPVPSITSNQPVCIGTNLNLSSTSAATYSWRGPQSFTSSLQNPSISVSDTLPQGTYTLVVSNSFGCIDSTTHNVDVSFVSPTISASGAACLGASFPMTASGGISYNWSGPNSFSSSNSSPTVSNVQLNKGGVYSVTITNAEGCTAQATTSLTVSIPPVVATGNSPVCEDNVLVLTAVGGVSYAWTGPRSYNSTIQNPNINIIKKNQEGIYSVTVTDSIGCTATASVNVVVNKNINARINQNGPICEGEDLELDGRGGDIYFWSGPNGFLSSDEDPIITAISAAGSGTYTLQVTDNDGCTVIVTEDVTIYPSPNISASALIKDICVGQTINLVSLTADQYNWTGPNGFSSSSQNPSISNATQAMTGIYTLVVRDLPEQCTSSAIVSVSVNTIPPPPVAPDVQRCGPGPAVLTASGCSGVYTWYGTNTSTTPLGTGATFTTPSLSSNSTYFVDCTEYTCPSSTRDQVAITILPTPTATASVTPRHCVGSTALFTGGGNNVSSYAWSGPQSWTSNSQSPNKLVSANNQGGTYTLTTTRSNGCTATATTNLVVINDCNNICGGQYVIIPTNPTTCGGTNGQVYIYTNNNFETSLDGINWTRGSVTYNNLGVGNYFFYVKDYGTQNICKNVSNTLVSTTNAFFTGQTVTAASDCYAANGSIQLQGVQPTDDVTWLATLKTPSVPVSTLTPTNTIDSLSPGTYYVKVSRSNNFCYAERYVVVPNNGTACNSATYCDDTNIPNLFPNGDFGSGAPENGPVLTETQYGYTNYTCFGPWDSFYSITNNTDCDGLGGRTFQTTQPYGWWQLLYEDHTPGDTDGYMMVVNAGYTPNIVIEKEIGGLCPNTQYNFTAWLLNISPDSPIQPEVAFIIDGVIQARSGPVIGSQWQQFGFSFKTGDDANAALFALRNIAPGGFGNNFIIDDIKVSKCPLDINLSGTTVACLGGSSEEINASIDDPYEEYTYFKWQKSDDNGVTWDEVSPVTQGTYISGSMNVDLTLPTPIVSALSGRIYRIRLATTAATIDDPECSVFSALTQIIVPPIELAITDDLEKCIGSGDVALTATASGGTAPYTYQWSGGLGNTANVNANPSVTTSYIVNAFDADNCPASDTVVVTVKDQPTLTVTIDEDSVCINGATEITARVVGGSGDFAFTWYSSTDATNWTEITGVTDSVHTPNTSVAGQLYYQVFVEDLTFDCNDATSNPILFTVVPLPTVSIDVNASPVCLGGVVELTANLISGAGDISSQWFESPDNISFTQLSGDTLGTYFPSTSVAGTQYYEVEVSASASGCSIVRSANVAVEILPSFEVDVTLDNAVVCISGAANLTATATNATGTVTYQWVSSTDGVNFSPISGATSTTFVAPTSVSGITYYQVVATASGSGCGSVTSATSSVEVLPVFEVDITINNAPVCIGGSVTLTADTTNGLGSVSYQWYGSLDNVNYTLIGGSTGVTYNPSTVSPGSSYFKVEATSTGAGCGTVESDAVEVVVLPVFSVSVSPNSSEVCVGGLVTLDADTTNGTGTVTYQWQVGTDNVTFADVPGATSQTLDPPTTLAGRRYYRVRATATGSGCGTVTSAGVEVNVLPVFDVTINIDNSILCLGGSSIITADTSGGSGTVTYQWYNSTDNVSFSPISGATGNTYTAPSGTVGTTYYRVEAAASGVGCGNATSSSASVQVLPVFDVDVTVDNSVVCIGGSVTLTADTTNGTGTVTYQWLSSGDNSTYAPISGATASTYTPSTASEGLTFYRVQATASGSGCGTVESDEVSVEVLPEFSVDVTASSSIVCLGGAVTLNADTTNGTGTVTYQWQESTNNSSFSNISGATSVTYTPSTGSEGIMYYRVIATATGSGCGSVTSASASIEVLPVFDVSVTLDNAILCLGGSATITADTSSGTGTVSYQWFSSTNNTTFSSMSGETGLTLSVPTGTVGTTYYRVEATASGVGCGNATSASASVEILPVFDVDISLTNSVVCLGGTAILTADTVNGTGTVTYQWFSSIDNVNYSSISGATSLTFSAPTSTEGSIYYQVQATASGSGCGTVESDEAVVEVLPVFSVDVNPSSSIVCVGGSVTINADTTNGTGIVTYQWQESSDNITFSNISGATGVTYSPLTSAEGINYYRVIATATGSGCGSVTSGSASVEVLPVFDVDIVVDNSQVCSFGVVTIYADTISGTGNISYQWYSSSDGVSFAAISGATLDSLVPSTATTGINYYRVEATASGVGCGNATSAVSTVTVEDQLSVTVDQTSAEVCLNESLTIQSTVTNGVGTITYQWQSSPDALVWTDISGETNSNLIVTTSTAGLYYYRVIASASGTGCNDANSRIISVRIHDYPSVSRSFIRPLCEPDNGSITFTFSDVAAIDSIMFSLDGGVTYPYVSGDDAGTFTVSGLSEQLYSLSAQYYGGLCPVTLTDVNMLGRPAPQVTSTFNDPTCSSPNGSITFTFPDEPTRTGIRFSIDGGSTLTGNIPDNQGSYTFNSLPSGTYELFAIWGNNDCPTALDTVQLIDQAAPVLSVSADTVICEGQSYTFSVSSTGGTSPITYTWDNGLGTNLSHTVSPISDTYYIVTVEDANNCIVSDTVFVEVNPVPFVTALGGTFCEFDTLLLSATGVGVFDWTGPNSFTSSDQNPQIASGTFANAGTYTVSLTNNFSCSSFATTEIIINVTPPSPNIVDGERCGPGVVNLQANTCTGTISWYDQQFASSPVSTGTSFATPNINESQFYFAECTTALNCASVERAPVLAKINELSVAQILPINTTCYGNIPINNGQMIATRFEDGETYSYNSGTVYNSGTASAFTPIPTNGVLSNSIPNPTAATQSYTIRINSVDACPRDYIVEYQESCTDCKLYCEPSSIVRIF